MSWVELGGWEVTALFLPEVAEVLCLKVRHFLSISEIRKVLGTETKTLPRISPMRAAQTALNHSEEIQECNMKIQISF